MVKREQDWPSPLPALRPQQRQTLLPGQERRCCLPFITRCEMPIFHTFVEAATIACSTINRPSSV